MKASPKQNPLPTLAIQVPHGEILAFCKKWNVLELSFFGSVVRGDFGPKSDVDVLVKYAPRPGWSLFDHVGAQSELAGILGRSVDLVSKYAIEQSRNPIRRKAILEGAKVYFSDEEAA